MSAVLFPQPAEAPKIAIPYWFVNSANEASSDYWSTFSSDAKRLKAGNFYATQAEAEQRCAWNAQEMARLVIPAWFRALGPDVEYQWSPGKWELNDSWSIDDWSLQKPADFRAKPKAAPDVVHVLDGVEYRWPSTVAYGTPNGDRYIVRVAGSTTDVEHSGASDAHGNRTHHTRAGADAQNAMLNAALGSSS